MDKTEYIDIILIGYFKEREYFKQYLIRQFKKAESKHIEEREFFSKCIDSVKLIADKLNEIPKIEGVYNVKIPLTYLSKEFNNGHIGYEDLKEITLRIKEAKDSINNIETPLKPNDKFKNIILKTTDEIKHKKISEKWLALLYWIELTANGQRPPINNEGGFIKSEIVKIGIEKTGTKGQSFYKQFRLINLNNSKELIGMFGKDWKQKIIHLSNNNQTIIDYIELKFK
ncbi:MAG: hypothetical protein ACYCZ2_12115 [Lutibacter sp.]